MLVQELGQLQRVDLRDVWKHEANDFTPWLVQHIDVLGKALDLDLEIVGSEHPVGDFAVDIVARDLATQRPVIVENQLEDTDHSHLGQLITYAAGVEASTVVWLSRNFREPHRQALDWLNRGHGTSTAYFGVVVELLKIDSSNPAVNFRVVASPNNWSRNSIRTAGTQEVNGKYSLYQGFFQYLIDELREKHKFTNARVAQAQNWYSFSTGTKGFQYAASFAKGGQLRAELYIYIGDGNQNLAALEALRSSKSQIEQQFGEPLEWEPLESKLACRVAVYRPGNIQDPSASLEEYEKWFIDRLLRFKAVFGPRLPEALAAAQNSTQSAEHILIPAMTADNQM